MQYYDTLHLLACSCGCGELVDAQQAIWDGQGVRAKAYASYSCLEAAREIAEETRDRFLEELEARNYNFEDSIYGEY